MTNPLILFTPPKKSSSTVDPEMFISGTLGDYSPFTEYESRLQINNNIGRCTVKLISGNLPVGATISVDNDTNEIVLKWPSYVEMAAPITNAQAENKKVGWSFSTGWGVSNSNPISGDNSFSFSNLKGHSYLLSNSKYPVTPGTTITASCQVRQGASSSGSAGASVVLKFFKLDGTDAETFEGNIVDSANNNAIKPSTVTASAPANAGYVCIGSKGFRKSQNEPLWVDDFVWDHTVPSAGTSEVLPYCINIRVRDSVGRIATWEGCAIGIAPPSLPKFLLAGVSSSIPAGFSISENGISFDPPFIPTNYFSNSVKVYSSVVNKVCAVSSSNIRTSNDQAHTFTLQPSFLYDFLPDGGFVSENLILVPLAFNAGIGRSTDNGETWTRVANNKTSSTIVISGNLVVSLGTPNQPMYSLDQGVTWSALGNRLDVYHPSSFNTGTGSCGASHEGVIYFGGAIWGGSYGVSSFIPGILSTTDGINFTAIKVSNAPNETIRKIAITDSLFVAVTETGHIYYKSESDWILSSQPAIGSVDVLTTNGETFILGGGSFGTKKLYSSTNGNNWTEIFNPFAENLSSLILID